MQTQGISPAVPEEIRWLLAVAGAVLPPALRSDWLREWYAEFCHSVGSGGGLRRQMWVRAFGAFPDAWVFLRQEYGLVRRIYDASHSRSAPVILLALLLTATALLTSGFSRGRNLLFRDDSAGLVLVAQPVSFMGGRLRMPAAQAEAWLQRSQTVSQLGRWSIVDRRRGERHVLVCRADPVALVLLSETPVKPPCRQIEPLGSNVLPFAGVVARLRNGASIQKAEQELVLIATMHKGWVRPGIVSLAAIRRAPLIPVGSTLFGLTLMSVLAVRVLTFQGVDLGDFADRVLIRADRRCLARRWPRSSTRWSLTKRWEKKYG